MLLRELAWAFSSTISFNSIVTLLLANGFTLACYYTDTVFPMRLDLIGIAVVFPLVFSINGAFQRREQALQHLAKMKANAFSIKHAFHHWMEGAFIATSGPKEIDKVMHNLFAQISAYFKSDEFSEVDYLKITTIFANISWMIEIHLRKGGVPAPNLSRVIECLRSLMQEFELLRNIKLYRTPLALRAYTKIFILLFPIIFAPLFAELATTSGLWGALLMSTLFSFILAGLDTIQDGIEEPFDGLGIDDVTFDQYLRHMRYPTVTPGHCELEFATSSSDVEAPSSGSVRMKDFDHEEKTVAIELCCDEELRMEELYPESGSRRSSPRSGAPMSNRL